MITGNFASGPNLFIQVSKSRSIKNKIKVGRKQLILETEMKLCKINIICLIADYT